jgi:hypothetical protein
MSPPSSGLKYKPSKTQQEASNFDVLHDVICQKRKLFISTSVRTPNANEMLCVPLHIFVF